MTADRLQDKAEQAKGGAKEFIGSVTGDESLEAEGRKDRAVGSIKEAGHAVKDAAEHVKDAMIKK